MLINASGLSKGWLYKESEVKARIKQLREQYGNKKMIKQKPSDASKDALIKTIKARNTKLAEDNKDLKRQLETVYGQLLNQKELQQKVKRLEAENQKLKDRLYKPVELSSVISDNSKGISPRINQELENLGITPSSTLARQIKNVEKTTVITAIEALKQQIDSTLIRNPEAWLAKAIKDSWKPNEAIGEEKDIDTRDTFRKWYSLARDYGVVIESRQENGVWFVKENTGEWFEYENFSQKWTFDYLQKVVSFS